MLLPNEKEKELPGKSFLDLLRGEQRAEKEQTVVVYDEYGPVRMIRTKEWKYVHRYPYGPHELYDLVHDPNEEQNLVTDAAYAEKIVELRGHLEDWFALPTAIRCSVTSSPAVFMTVTESSTRLLHLPWISLSLPISRDFSLRSRTRIPKRSPDG